MNDNVDTIAVKMNIPITAMMYTKNPNINVTTSYTKSNTSLTNFISVSSELLNDYLKCHFYSI